MESCTLANCARHLIWGNQWQLRTTVCATGDADESDRAVFPNGLAPGAP
jgi:hypothetical protein